ncbi:Uncharacterized protein FWK35_00030338 [Aphis craccivora]|uniref:Uncharacterized protein n=1 Tax=Aphis craccivora TaxID=307492 RepID=A0A6G0VMQ5_APHCR|nr:Uncharacterized protein FWK35_00030338 [Aphis craccivora]
MIDSIAIKSYNSEQSDECIDFTMIISRNNASISNIGGGFRWKNEYPLYIIEVKSKHSPTVLKINQKTKKNKMTEKREFLRKTIQIFTKSIENAKICNISRKNLKILPLKIHKFFSD